MSLNPTLSCAAWERACKGRPVQLLMLEIHDVAGLPLGRDPGVDPCRKGLEKTSCLVTWPNHINLNFLTSFASRILAPMMSLISSRIDWLVRRSWYVTPKSRRKHFISKDEILLIDEADNVQDWHPYKTVASTIDLTKRNLVGKESGGDFQMNWSSMIFCFPSARRLLISTSDLPSDVITAPKYLNWETSSIRSLPTWMHPRDTIYSQKVQQLGTKLTEYWDIRRPDT